MKVILALLCIPIAFTARFIDKEQHFPIYENQEYEIVDVPFLEYSAEDLEELGLTPFLPIPLELDVLKYDICIGEDGSTTIIYYDID